MKKLIFTALAAMLVFTGVAYGQVQNDAHIGISPDTSQFNPEQATMNYLATLSPDQKERSDDYFEGGYLITLGNFVMEVIIALIFLFFGLSGWVEKIVSRVKNINLRNLAYIFIYLLLAYLIAFPLNVYTGFFREHHFNLSNLSFGGWFGEEMISLGLSTLFGGLLIMALYIAIRKVTDRWWIWGSAGAIVFLIISLFLSPVFIAPLFNKYTPLEDGPVKEEILSLARANGVPVDNVYQFNASKQSTRISANVSGIGSTIRVSLNDNLLNNCTTAEIKSVMAHELGHYVLNHISKLLIYMSIVVIAGFAFVNWLMKKLLKRFRGRWGISHISDIGTLPLFVVTFSFFMLLAGPVMNNISRSTESEADIFGLNAAREPDGFASVSMKLSDYRKVDPGRLEEIFFYDHPSGKARVLMAMKWKAENLDDEKH